jgi:hypothetical protein
VALPFAVHCPPDVSRGSPGVEWGRFPLVVSTVFYCAYFALGNNSAPPALVPHMAKVYRFVNQLWSSPVKIQLERGGGGENRAQHGHAYSAAVTRHARLPK